MEALPTIGGLGGIHMISERCAVKRNKFFTFVATTDRPANLVSKKMQKYMPTPLSRDQMKAQAIASGIRHTHFTTNKIYHSDAFQRWQVCPTPRPQRPTHRFTRNQPDQIAMCYGPSTSYCTGYLSKPAASRESTTSHTWVLSGVLPVINPP